jgi:hypothetical protein
LLKSIQKPNSFQSFLLLPGLLLLLTLVLSTGVAQAARFPFLENGNSTPSGSDAALFPDTPTRQRIDLSGNWEFSIDHGASGTVRIPAAYDATGTVTLSRSFELTAEQLDHYQFQLVMLGVNYSCEISVNGEFVVNHVGGYTGFVQTIPKDFLQPGKGNRIQVVVNNELDPRRTIPPQPLVDAPRNYGGILRDVFILATPLQYIRETIVTSELAENGESALVHVRAAVEGKFSEPPPTIDVPKGKPLPKAVPAVYFEIVERLGGDPVARSGNVNLVHEGDGWADVLATAKVESPKLWTPDTPELYVVKCYLVMAAGKEVTILDEHDVSFGVRHLVVDEGDFMLNGRRLTLKGVLWKEQHPTWGSALPYEQMEKDILLIKNIGANLVRFADHPPHPYMLDLCDRYGLLALVELPVSGVPPAILGQEAYAELATGMLREMIVRDRNHPCVLAWGLGDGFESSRPEVRRFVETLAGVGPALDARPLYYATPLLSGDICSDLVGLTLVSIHSDDIKGFKARLESLRESHTNKPLVIAGIGTEVQQNNRNGYSDPLSQEAQARYCLQRLDAAKAMEYDGAIIESFNDWRGDRPALTVHSPDRWLHSTGLVSGQREKRTAYEAVRSSFRGEKYVALPAGSYSPGAPMIYVLTGFVVLVGIAYLYNSNRRFRESVNRSLFNTYNFFADVRDQRSVSIIQTTVLGLVVSVATAIVLSSIFYHFRTYRILDNVLSSLLVSDDVKVAVVRFIWNPLEFIAVASVLVFLGLVLLCLSIPLLRLVFRHRIYMFHAYAVTMWSTAPLLLLVPIGMILYRVMDSSVYVLPSLAFLAVLFFWVLLRFLKGISIIFDVFPSRMYALGLVTVAVLLGVCYVYYNSASALPEYVAYMVRIAAGS